jgi:EpsI family protein
MTRSSVRLFILAFCMAATALYLSVVSRAEELPPHAPLSTLAMSIDGWEGRREPDLTPDVLKVLGVDDYVTRTYRKQRQLLGLYIGFHESQRQGDTIHSPLNCLPGAGWQPVDQRMTTLDVVGAPGHDKSPTRIEVNRVTIEKGLDRQLVLYWYQSPRRIVANEYWGKVYTVLDAARYNRTDAALVRIVVPISPDQPADAAEQTAVAFAQGLFPFLGRHLPS